MAWGARATLRLKNFNTLPAAGAPQSHGLVNNPKARRVSDVIAPPKPILDIDTDGILVAKITDVVLLGPTRIPISLGNLTKSAPAEDGTFPGE